MREDTWNGTIFMHFLCSAMRPSPQFIRFATVMKVYLKGEKAIPGVQSFCPIDLSEAEKWRGNKDQDC